MYLLVWLWSQSQPLYCSFLGLSFALGIEFGLCLSFGLDLNLHVELDLDLWLCLGLVCIISYLFCSRDLHLAVLPRVIEHVN
jgi:hypothetical protein